MVFAPPGKSDSDHVVLRLDRAEDANLSEAPEEFDFVYPHLSLLGVCRKVVTLPRVIAVVLLVLGLLFLPARPAVKSSTNYIAPASVIAHAAIHRTGRHAVLERFFLLGRAHSVAQAKLAAKAVLAEREVVAKESEEQWTQAAADAARTAARPTAAALPAATAPVSIADSTVESAVETGAVAVESVASAPSAVTEEEVQKSAEVAAHAKTAADAARKKRDKAFAEAAAAEVADPVGGIFAGSGRGEAIVGVELLPVGSSREDR